MGKVQLTHSGRGRTSGAVWAHGATPADAWTAEFALDVAGAADESDAGGVALWYGTGTTAPAGDGVFGIDPTAFVGVGVVFETGTTTTTASTRVAVVQSTKPGGLPASSAVFDVAQTQPSVRARGTLPFALAGRAAPVHVRVACAADGALTVAVAETETGAFVPCATATSTTCSRRTGSSAHATLGFSAATRGLPYRPGHPGTPGGLGCSVSAVRAAFRAGNGDSPALSADSAAPSAAANDVAGAAAMAALDAAAVRVQNAVREVQGNGESPGAALAALRADADALAAVGRADYAREVLAASAGAQGRASTLAERAGTVRRSDEAADKRTFAWLREEERREMLTLHVGVDGVQVALLAGIVAALALAARLWSRTRTEADHKKLY